MHVLNNADPRTLSGPWDGRRANDCADSMLAHGPMRVQSEPQAPDKGSVCEEAARREAPSRQEHYNCGGQPASLWLLSSSLFPIRPSFLCFLLSLSAPLQSVRASPPCTLSSSSICA